LEFFLYLDYSIEISKNLVKYLNSLIKVEFFKNILKNLPQK
jgi:hypothetical protein